MRVSQSNAATERGNWHILRQVYISGRIYRKNSRKFDLDQIWDHLDHLLRQYIRGLLNGGFWYNSNLKSLNWMARLAREVFLEC